ncbi:murein L,D-transpeptidase YcbB/YkuD [Mucilaginibacter sp. UYP25]|uniref:L,D-transpeptidase family protein n=1 Tax=unclassified Mucilaginibacter TaxID=2617802 RepID=UPI00339A5F04
MKNIFVITCICYLLLPPFQSAAANTKDSLIAKEITRLLDNGEPGLLHFPGTVKRLYQQNGKQPIWMKPQSGEGPAWQVMMMLDCVLQYGLSPGDYHPEELTYNRMHQALDTPANAGVNERARLEIVLTDAMITFLNHLHYGKFNRQYTTAVIDGKDFKGFHADSAILVAIHEKRAYDFWANAEKAQPVTKAYRELQRRMRLLEGQYAGDNYEVSNQEIRLIAINMERLRWQNLEEGNYIRINLPAYALQYHEHDNDYTFRVAVGSKVNHTPELSGRITYLTTAPDVVVPRERFINELLPAAIRDTAFLKKNKYALYDKSGRYIVINSKSILAVTQHPNNYNLRHASGHDAALGRLVFRFTNPYRIDLHDMPRKAFFDQDNRAITTGCVWLDDAEKLGQLVLTNDGQPKSAKSLPKAMKKYQREVFMLGKPLPITIVYQTCAIKEGELITYPDIYQKDVELEVKLFPPNEILATR